MAKYCSDSLVGRHQLYQNTLENQEYHRILNKSWVHIQVRSVVKTERAQTVRSTPLQREGTFMDVKSAATRHQGQKAQQSAPWAQWVGNGPSADRRGFPALQTHSDMARLLAATIIRSPCWHRLSIVAHSPRTRRHSHEVDAPRSWRVAPRI